MKKFCFWVLLTFFVFGTAFGQDARRGGVSASVGIGIPFMGMAEWYRPAPQVGIRTLFFTSSNTQVYLEFHFQRFGHGAIETRTFKWLVDGQYYSCPKASAHMVWNDFILGLRTLLPNHAFRLLGRSFTPYFSYGGGLYNYVHHVSGLIYPGQPRVPLDKNFLMEPVSDRRVAWGATLGTGLWAKWSDRISGSLQLNYHAVVGYLRPFEDWGLSEVFPLQFFDFRLGFTYFY